jgi:rare lipoprotein A
MLYSQKVDSNKIYTASYYAYNTTRYTASGQKFNNYGLTAAHKTLPFGTKVKVTNVNNGKSVIVTVNDRGPYKKSLDFKYYTRVLDLAKGAYLKISDISTGIVKIKYEILE